MDSAAIQITSRSPHRRAQASPSSFHAHEVQPQIAHQVEHAIQMRLIADLSNEAGLLDIGFHVQPLEGGHELLCQLSPDSYPVSSRLQVASRHWRPAVSITLRAPSKAFGTLLDR